MELKPGYKQTEVGVIPEDWEVASVGEKGQVLAGKALAVNAPGKQRPYLRTKNVFDGRIDVEDVLSMPMTDEQFSQFQLRHGDVLLNEGQSLDLVGRCSVYKEEYPEPCAIQNALLRFRANTGTSATFATHLFRHCQQTGVFAKIALQTTSVAHLGSSRFANLKLAWPTENEQRLIAEALDELDALLGSLKAAITKKTALKQAAMQELLTGKRRLPGFEGEWEVMRLGSEIRDLQAGVSVTSTTDNDQTNTDHYVLKTSAVVQGRFIPSEKKEINPGEVKRAKTSIRKGDLIISRMNTLALVGECGYSDSDHPNLYLPDRLWRAAYRDPSAISSHWLSYALSMQQNRIRIKELATGTSGSMKNISKRALLNLEIKWPSLEEQTAIAEILSAMDADIDAIGEHLLKAQGIKQGMMQQLLTGKIRLK